MRADELVAGDVIVVSGERLTVNGAPRLDRNTAVIPTRSATENVTVYLRAAGAVALLRPSPIRSALSAVTLAADPQSSARPIGQRAAS